MNGSAVIRRLHEHRMWANRRLLNSARSLTAEQLRTSFPIGQGSIWRSLTHLYAAESVWLAALLGHESFLVQGDVPGKLPGNQEGEGAIGSLDELQDLWDRLDQRWNEYLRGLTDELLDEIVYRVSSSSGAGRRFGNRRADVLLHVCTHGQYTTAQIANMLRHVQAGEIPDTMLITLARNQTVLSPG